jgi:hypothetical protein
MSVLALKRQLKSEGKMRSGVVVDDTIHHYQTPLAFVTAFIHPQTETLELTQKLHSKA